MEAGEEEKKLQSAEARGKNQNEIGEGTESDKKKDIRYVRFPHSPPPPPLSHVFLSSPQTRRYMHAQHLECTLSSSSSSFSLVLFDS